MCHPGMDKPEAEIAGLLKHDQDSMADFYVAQDIPITLTE